MLENRPARQNGLKKKVIAGVVADPVARTRFYLHKVMPRGRDRILSTQRIGGGDLEENGHFLKRKRVAR